MRRPQQRPELPFINERLLRFRELRVIGEDGQQMGVISPREALQMARDAGLDLVLVSQTANPPVAKIIDYGRFKYLQEKQQKESKKKTQDVKGVKLRPGTADNDLRTLLRNAQKFLQEGDKVRVVCQFRAREVTHPEIGLRKMQMIAQELAEMATVERTPSLEGKQMVMVLIPKPATGGKRNAKEQDQDKQNGSEAVQDHGNREDHAPEGLQQPHVLQQEHGASPPS